MANLKNMIEYELKELGLGWKDVEAVVVCCLDSEAKDLWGHEHHSGCSHLITAEEAEKLFDY